MSWIIIFPSKEEKMDNQKSYDHTPWVPELNDHCKNCNNRPTANDPYKVCHCTLGLPTVTC